VRSRGESELITGHTAIVTSARLAQEAEGAGGRLESRPHPEAVAVSDQDSRGVPMTRTVLLGGLDEPLDFPVGEIFTAALANCYIY
jgi:pyridoxine/pyridoxamine 5'-phosphate oxidase